MPSVWLTSLSGGGAAQTGRVAQRRPVCRVAGRIPSTAVDPAQTAGWGPGDGGDSGVGITPRRAGRAVRCGVGIGIGYRFLTACDEPVESFN